MRLIALVLAFVPMMSFAAGSETDAPPEPSETTQVCAEGQVWDLATKTCLPPEQSTNDDSALLRDVRELAYDGQYEAAINVLHTLDNPSAPLALTYFGFAHRKAGCTPLGMAFYARALAADPDNFLARSYKGQAHIVADEWQEAKAQLDEIRARGGAGTWAEASLISAIETGATYSY